MSLSDSTTATPASSRASARGARLADLVLCVLVDVASALGDAGAVGSWRTT